MSANPFAERLRETLAALRQVRAERDALLSKANDEPIAIIGYGCRFPGAASPEGYWRLLAEGRDAVREIPPERWPRSALPREASPGTRWAGLLDDVTGFDAAFFGISPREAESLDPQQRLLLEVAWESLEDAGQRPDRLAGSATGVFLGLYSLEYQQRVLESGQRDLDAYFTTGNILSVAAGRLSYVLGLQGPCMTVDTACSSSLTAVALACQSLRSGESALALAGGANLLVSPRWMAMAATTQALSPDGRCRTFDARANGFVRSEGCGLVALKRLSDAQRDGDRIRALIRGWAINQDGRSAGLTAPNVLSQQALLRRAYDHAGVSPAEVGYIEMHGTGTPLGDPIEAAALREVVGAPRPDGSRCALGAAKTNLGHLESAAGIAGLIKATLVLERGEVPGNLHFERLNPRISLEGSALTFAREPVPWRRGEKPRVAGVSAFGLSGTNVHLVLAEAPAPRAPAAAPAPDAPDAAPAAGEGSGSKSEAARAPSFHWLPLSAKCPGALAAMARDWASHLESLQGDVPLADVCYTAGVRRAQHEHRLAVAGRTPLELAAALKAASEASSERALPAGSDSKRRVFVFPGQGSQWLGMGRTLLAEEPAFRDALRACDEAVRRHGGFSVEGELTAGEATSRLSEIDVVQPTLFAVEVALASLWRSWGVVPDAVVGHSMGEVAAAVFAGILSLEDGARIICARSRLAKRVSGKGAMAAVELDLDGARRAIAGFEDRLSVAVSNGPRSTVLSGDAAAMDEMLARLSEEGVFCRKVKVDFASHSPQVDELRADLLEALSEVQPRAARIAMVSTVTGKAVEGQELDAAYWVRNLREPVLFSGVTRQFLEQGQTAFIEVSPHPILLPAVEENLQDQPGSGLALPTLRRGVEERLTLLETMAALYTAGHPVDLARVLPSTGRLVSVPPYPWQRRRYWLDVSSPVAAESSALGKSAETRFESLLLSPEWRPAPALSELQGDASRWLVLDDGGPLGQGLRALLQERGADSCFVRRRGPASAALDADPVVDPAAPEELDALVAKIAGASSAPLRVVQLWAVQEPGALEPTLDRLDEGLERGWGTTLHLANALARHAKSARLSLVTRGAQPVAPGDRLALAESPLWGLGRTLAAERPELGVRRIDLDPAAPPDEARALLSELLSEDREEEVALRGGRRYVGRLVRGAPVPEGRASPAVVADGRYLITGGLGGLGLLTAGWLVAEGARHLVLLGRQGVRTAEQAEALSRLRASGAEVTVLQADVSEPEALEQGLASLPGDAPPLRGVFHLAAILDDGVLENQTTERFRRVLAPKVRGAWNLHRLTAGQPLDFFVLYSSMASLLGTPGQGNYAAANAFLDALAHHRRRLGLAASSVNWGLWAGIGLGPAEQESHLVQAAGARGFSARQGAELFRRVLRGAWIQAGVVDLDLDRMAQAFPGVAASPRYSTLRSVGAETGSTAPSDRLDALRQMPRAERAHAVEALIRRRLAGILRIDEGELRDRRPFQHFGFDSLMALELRRWVSQAFGVALSVADILGNPQSDKVAALILPRLAPEGAAPGGEAPPKTCPATEAAAAPRAGSAVVIPRPSPDARIRLFCFPYAGGAVPVFSPWAALLPPEIELCAIQLPGRHERLREPLLTSVEAMAADLVPALLPYLDRPFATFGHCLGAIVMSEVLERLRREHGREPELVFAAGAPAPPVYLAPSLGGRSPEEFRDVLRAIGFASEEALRDEDIGARMLPAVAADFEAAAGYRYRERPPFEAPIIALSGADDAFGVPESMVGWREQTTGWWRHVIVPGGHYFIVPERERIASLVSQELLGRLAALAQRPGPGQQRAEEYDAPGTSRWIRRAATRLDKRFRLVALAGRGQSASAFDVLEQHLPGWLAFERVELPGHGVRADELPLTRAEEIADRVVAALRESSGLPFALLGADVGSLLAFEIARRLQRAGSALPSHLFCVSGAAPHVQYLAHVHHLGAEALFRMLGAQGIRFQGTPNERAVRADCAVMASYDGSAPSPLSTPITAVIGSRDPCVARGAAEAWGALTTGGFDLQLVPGGHDLLSESARPLGSVLVRALARPAGLGPGFAA